MSYEVSVILSTVTIAIAAIIGLVRFKKINPSYYPFIAFLVLGLLAELINATLAYLLGSNMISINIYLLLEALLLTWQFKKWGMFTYRQNVFWILLIFFTALWIVQVFFLSGIHKMPYYYLIAGSFVLTMMSIWMINFNIVQERKNVLLSPVFLICSAFILYFTLRVIVYASWLYGKNIDLNFRVFVLSSMVYVNLFTNLVYAFAVLWMPKKQRFSIPS